MASELASVPQEALAHLYDCRFEQMQKGPLGRASLHREHSEAKLEKGEVETQGAKELTPPQLWELVDGLITIGAS